VNEVATDTVLHPELRLTAGAFPAKKETALFHTQMV